MNYEALHEHFDQQSQLPQRLGVVDCVTFVVESLLVGWGRDYRDVFGYWDRRSAVKQLREADGLLQAAIDRLGEPVPASELKMGDVVWIPRPPTLGLLIRGAVGTYVAVKGHYAIHQYNLDQWAIGWRTN